MTELRRQMDDDMVVRGMAVRTRETYLAAVKGLAKYYRRSPDQISDEEVQAYLLHLIRDRHRSWNTCHTVVHGLRFLYHTTLKRDRTTFSIPSMRQPGKLPTILSREEVERIIAHATNVKHRTMLMTIYAAGLRLNEALHLRVTDIDSARMTIRVEQGKGGKDRYTVLSRRLLDALRVYWKSGRPSTWLFPSQETGEPLHPTALQRAYQQAKLHAGHHQTRRHSRAASCVCDAPPRGRRRPPHHSTPARAQGPQYDESLHPADAPYRDGGRLPARICSAVYLAAALVPCAPCRRARWARTSLLA